ncbi:unnamed protein product [Schistosoma bovis]|nr:unnamed protein product [Schistosoma bovis]
MMKISVVVPILLVLLSSVESARRCKVAESIKPRDGVYSQNTEKRLLKSRNLKIIPIYDVELQRSKAFPKIKNAIESASSYWERALVVNVDKQESLLVRRECVNNRLIIPGKEKQTYCDMGGCEQTQECYEFKIPNDYLSACYQQKSNKNVLVFPEGKGIAPNELVLFVKNVYFGVCDEYVVAWASFCDRDPTNGRPFVGIVNFCPSVDDILKTEDYDLILTAKHELGHVLGFHGDIFSSLPRLKPEFRLSNNDPSPIQNITIKWKSARGVFNIQKTIMRLPNMISEAQKHFGCNEIPGIQLDSNHLSHRVMGNDILTPNRLESNLVSRILLAYFKDTNMYDVDYSMADDFKWGKGLGCDFVMKSCYEFIQKKKMLKQDIQPFCDTPWEKRCINYDRAIGRCSLFDSETELPLHFQYADNSFNVPRDKQTYYSGPDIYDYCPVYEMFKLYNGRTSACRFNLNLKSDLINNEYLEDMGPDSTCFDHEKILRKNKTTNEAYPRTSSCHKYKCSKNADLQVIINGKSFPCRAGDRSAHLKLEVQNVELSTDIHCPPCQSVCNESCPR